MSFRDVNGREYLCVVNLATVISLKQRHGININDIGQGDLLTRIANDPELLVNMLWACCEGSAKSLGVDEIQFAQSLGGDSLESAIDSMLDAIILFFPPLKRGAMTRLMDKSRQVQRLASERAMTAIEELTPEQILTSYNSVSSKGD